MNAVALPRDPTAVVGRRIGAFVLDLIIVFVVAFGAARGLVDLKRETVPSFIDASQACDIIEADNPDITFCFHSNDTVFYSEQSSAGALVMGLPTLAALLNAVVLQGLTGASIGKHLVGLRVVRRESGAVAGVGKAFVRWIVGIVDWAPWCFPIVGLVLVLTTKGHRRLGDMAAGTLVVGKDDVGSPALAGLNAPVAMAPAPGAWPPPSPQPPAGAWGATPGQPGGTWGAPSPSAPTPPAPPTWDAPPTTWAPPTAPPMPAPAPTPEPPAAAPAPMPAPAPEPARDASPQWDPARNAYLSWDAASGQWLQWDDTTQSWGPLR